MYDHDAITNEMPDVFSSPYDAIAGMYNVHWADWYLPAALPALERLFFDRVLAQSRVLDVCCGSGHVTKELVRRGYTVTGVDSSAELIKIARQRLPQVDFRVADVRNFVVKEKLDAALSTFDSLNHLLTLEDLRAAFRQVHAALKPGALFVFDMNLEDAYLLDLRQWTVDVKDNEVTMVRGTYDLPGKIATTQLMWFVRTPNDECWHLHKSTVEQRCYPPEEIVNAVAAAGFQDIEAIDARDAGMSADIGLGRIFVSARA